MPKIIVLAIILSILLKIAEAATIFRGKTTKYSQCQNTLFLSNSRLAGTTESKDQVQVQGVSYYDNGNGDVIQVTYAVVPTPGANPVSWTITLSTLVNGLTGTSPTITKIITTQSTIQPTIIGFLKKVLIIKQTTILTNNDIKIYYNGYVADGKGIKVPLSLPTGKTSTTFNMKIISATQTNIITTYLEGKTGYTLDFSGFYTYLLLGKPSPVLLNNGNNQWNKLIVKPSSFHSFIGNPNFFIDTTPGVVNPVVQYTTSGYLRVNLTTFGPNDIKTDKICSFTLNNNLFGLLILQSDKLSGTLGIKQGSASFSSKYTYPSGTDVKAFTDGLLNLLVVNSKKIIWIFASNPYLITQLTPDPKGLDSDIYSTDNVRLAGDKAFALYQNRLVIYRNSMGMGSNAYIQLFSSIALAKNLAIPSYNFNYRITISCQCYFVKLRSVTCFSTSLNCVVLSNKMWNPC